MIDARQQRRLRQFLFYLLLLSSSLLALVPVFWIWISSLKSNKEIRTSALALPSQLHFENYVDAWVGAHFSQYFLNSTLVALSAVIIVLTVGSLAAYAFARMAFRGNQLLFLIVFIGMTFPVSHATWTATYSNVQAELGRYPLGPHLRLCSGFVALCNPHDAFLFSAVSQGTRRCFTHRWMLQSTILCACSLAALHTGVVHTRNIFAFMGAWNEFSRRSDPH